MEDPKRLKHLFRQLLKNKNHQLRIAFLQGIIDDEIHLPSTKVTLSAETREVLPEMLVYYITNWPGWNKEQLYRKKKITMKEWFKRFHRYLCFKMKLLVDKTIDAAISEMAQLKSGQQNTIGTQFAEKEAVFSDCALTISGPPKLLGTLHFFYENNDIYVSEHSHQDWNYGGMTLNAFFNWPCVQVEFFSPDLNFVRSFSPKTLRFLSASNDHKIEKENLVMSTHIWDHSKKQECFTFDILRAYIVQYKHLLKKWVSLTADEYYIISAILSSFLMDIEELNVDNSIATNTYIAYNMGENVYTRTKKSVNPVCDDSPLIYTEILHPCTVLLLKHFKVEQDKSKPLPCFKSLNHAECMPFNTPPVRYFIPCIRYTCTFCKEGYDNKELFFQHLVLNHGGEQSLLCHSCKRLSNITNLSRFRWRCPCQTSGQPSL